ncbi:hypothetical protein BDC45DRAFT_284009 [Circinella umbellata]|nr:hypothetical protein BDC45DRAFT_284009 [Circinella umbellata]
MPLKTQSESSKTKKKSAVPVKISIESLRHDLNLPEFWIKNPWQKWCVQNYDIEAIKINPGIKRAFAHQNLTNDIKTILNAYKNKSTGREYERIKQIKSDLKNIHKNRTNNYFWREQAVKESKLATENEILEKRKEIARKTYEVATIKNLAKELDSVKSKKRNHDDIDKEQMQAKNKRPTYASSISRSEEEENDDEEEEEEENEEDNEEEKEEENEEDDDDKSTDLLNQGIQEQDDNDEADNSVKENQVGTSGRDVCEVVNDNGDIDTFEARQELFAWAFNLINKEPHAKNDKMIEQLRRKTKTKIDHLNLLSLCLLDGWPINNEVLENLLR